MVVVVDGHPLASSTNNIRSRRQQQQWTRLVLSLSARPFPPSKFHPLQPFQPLSLAWPGLAWQQSGDGRAPARRSTGGGEMGEHVDVDVDDVSLDDTLHWVLRKGGRFGSSSTHYSLTHTHTLYCTSPSRSAALARVLLLFFPPKEEEKEDSSHWWWQSTNREKETTVEHTKNETAICCCLCHD